MQARFSKNAFGLVSLHDLVFCYSAVPETFADSSEIDFILAGALPAEEALEIFPRLPGAISFEEWRTVRYSSQQLESAFRNP
jgi:hypothetical protein